MPFYLILAAMAAILYAGAAMAGGTSDKIDAKAEKDAQSFGPAPSEKGYNAALQRMIQDALKAQALDPFGGRFTPGVSAAFQRAARDARNQGYSNCGCATDSAGRRVGPV